MAAATPELGRRPRVFVSSTILDLRDLRSAVKYFLEESGFDVILSEFPTFPHTLDQSARLAAIPAIGDCDYFILIIGDRYGSLLDEGVSVTRTEFREARKLAVDGRMRLIPFARESVFDFWRHGLNDVPGIPEWPAIRSFLDEVNEEHGNASNWIHRFSSFRDVSDALRAQLRLSRPLRMRALEANLLWELRANIKACHYARAGHPPLAIAALFTKETLPEPGEGDSGLDDTQAVTHHQARLIAEFNLLVPGGARGLKRNALDDAIASGEFLEFDAATSGYKVGPVQALLLDLAERIAQFEFVVNDRHENKWYTGDMGEVLAAARRGSTRGATLQSMTLRMLFAMRNQLWNIFAETTALARLLSGLDHSMRAAFVVPIIPPPTEITPESDREMNDEEVNQFLERAGGKAAASRQS